MYRKAWMSWIGWTINCCYVWTDYSLCWSWCEHKECAKNHSFACGSGKRIKIMCWNASFCTWSGRKRPSLSFAEYFLSSFLLSIALSKSIALVILLPINKQTNKQRWVWVNKWNASIMIHMCKQTLRRDLLLSGGRIVGGARSRCRRNQMDRLGWARKGRSCESMECCIHPTILLSSFFAPQTTNPSHYLPLLIQWLEVSPPDIITKSITTDSWLMTHESTTIVSLPCNWCTLL